MTQQELFNALDGLYAYDMGAADNGVKDEPLRQKVKNHLESLSDVEYFKTLSIFVRDRCLSDAFVEQGYGIEDAIRFIKWLRDYMDHDLGI